MKFEKDFKIKEPIKICKIEIKKPYSFKIYPFKITTMLTGKGVKKYINDKMIYKTINLSFKSLLVIMMFNISSLK